LNLDIGVEMNVVEDYLPKSENNTLAVSEFSNAQDYLAAFIDCITSFMHSAMPVSSFGKLDLVYVLEFLVSQFLSPATENEGFRVKLQDILNFMKLLLEAGRKCFFNWFGTIEDAGKVLNSCLVNQDWFAVTKNLSPFGRVVSLISSLTETSLILQYIKVIFTQVFGQKEIFNLDSLECLSEFELWIDCFVLLPKENSKALSLLDILFRLSYHFAAPVMLYCEEFYSTSPTWKFLSPEFDFSVLSLTAYFISTSHLQPFQNWLSSHVLNRFKALVSNDLEVVNSRIFFDKFSNGFRTDMELLFLSILPNLILHSTQPELKFQYLQFLFSSKKYLVSQETLNLWSVTSSFLENVVSIFRKNNLQFEKNDVSYPSMLSKCVERFGECSKTSWMVFWEVEELVSFCKDFGRSLARRLENWSLSKWKDYYAIKYGDFQLGCESAPIFLDYPQIRLCKLLNLELFLFICKGEFPFAALANSKDGFLMSLSDYFCSELFLELSIHSKLLRTCDRGNPLQVTYFSCVKSFLCHSLTVENIMVENAFGMIIRRLTSSFLNSLDMKFFRDFKKIVDDYCATIAKFFETAEFTDLFLFSILRDASYLGFLEALLRISSLTHESLSKNPSCTFYSTLLDFYYKLRLVNLPAVKQSVDDKMVDHSSKLDSLSLMFKHLPRDLLIHHTDKVFSYLPMLHSKNADSDFYVKQMLSKLISPHFTSCGGGKNHFSYFDPPLVVNGLLTASTDIFAEEDFLALSMSNQTIFFQYLKCCSNGKFLREMEQASVDGPSMWKFLERLQQLPVEFLPDYNREIYEVYWSVLEFLCFNVLESSIKLRKQMLDDVLFNASDRLLNSNMLLSCISSVDKLNFPSLRTVLMFYLKISTSSLTTMGFHEPATVSHILRIIDSLKVLHNLYQHGSSSVEVSTFFDVELFGVLNDWVKSILKFHFGNTIVLKLFTQFVQLFYSLPVFLGEEYRRHANSTSLPPKTLLLRIVTHSKLKEILATGCHSYGTGSENVAVGILQLILYLLGIIHEFDSTLKSVSAKSLGFVLNMDNEHLQLAVKILQKLLLVNYSGTMSIFDLLVFQIWSYLYKNNKTRCSDNAEFSVDIPNIIVLKLMSSGVPVQESLLQLLKQKVVHSTLNNFPVRRSLSIQAFRSDMSDSTVIEHNDISFYLSLPLFSQEKEEENEVIYDPAFVAPLIFVSVKSLTAAGNSSPEEIHNQQLRKLINGGALALLFMSLSSLCPRIRTVAVYSLSEIFKLLNQSPDHDAAFSEKPNILLLLSFLKNGLQEDDTSIQLPANTALFLAKASMTLLLSTHFLYPAVGSYLLSKPFLDRHDVPLFEHVLFSSENPSILTTNSNLTGDELRSQSAENLKSSKLLVLRLLRDSLKSIEDHTNFVRKNVYSRLLMIFDLFCEEDVRFGIVILEILDRAICLQNDSFVYLIKKSDLMVWISKYLKLFLTVPKKKNQQLSFHLLFTLLTLVRKTVNAFDLQFRSRSDGKTENDYYFHNFLNVQRLLSVLMQFLREKIPDGPTAVYIKIMKSLSILFMDCFIIFERIFSQLGNHFLLKMYQEMLFSHQIKFVLELYEHYRSNRASYQKDISLEFTENLKFLVIYLSIYIHHSVQYPLFRTQIIEYFKKISFQNLLLFLCTELVQEIIQSRSEKVGGSSDLENLLVRRGEFQNLSRVAMDAEAVHTHTDSSMSYYSNISLILENIGDRLNLKTANSEMQLQFMWSLHQSMSYQLFVPQFFPKLESLSILFHSLVNFLNFLLSWTLEKDEFDSDFTSVLPIFAFLYATNSPLFFPENFPDSSLQQQIQRIPRFFPHDKLSSICSLIFVLLKKVLVASESNKTVCFLNQMNLETLTEISLVVQDQEMKKHCSLEFFQTLMDLTVTYTTFEERFRVMQNRNDIVPEIRRYQELIQKLLVKLTELLMAGSIHSNDPKNLQKKRKLAEVSLS
jgi:hypothetical protein